MYYLTTATRIYWKNKTTRCLTICSNWVVSSHYLNINYIVISDRIARKKKNKVTGWLHLATWVFLLILILCITMVNFLKFLWQIFDEVFDQFFWQQCRNRKSCSFLAINLFIFSAPGQDLTHFVSNGTKLNIPLQTKPPKNDAMIIMYLKKKIPEKQLGFVLSHYCN